MTRFDAARREALMQDLLAPLLGRPADLLPFDVVRQRLRLRGARDRGVEEVPLDRIVGSVQRDREFTRAFLPRDESLRNRWERVDRLAESERGFPPVELYRVGDAHFVVDGHHRVSVARSVAAPTIEARVQEFPTSVPLDSTATVEDVLLKEGLSSFLDATGLVPATPDEFRVTEPDGYQRLLDHVVGHRHFRGVELQRHVPWEEAVASWRDTVYRPMIATIRGSGILEDFPGRTETDLYLFTMHHLHHLRERYGPGLGAASAVRHYRLLRRSERPSLLERVRTWWKERAR